MGYHYQFSIKTLLSKMEKTEEKELIKRITLWLQPKKKTVPAEHSGDSLHFDLNSAGR